MKDQRTSEVMMTIEKMVNQAIDTGDYRLIRDAMDIAGDNEIFMSEDEDFVMVEDDVFYFDGAF